ncbi:sensor histidine kinase [Streptomyces fructofermentans]|uniref:Signal transduction histidine-protein kinase/phosphatase MprB n=1 Tax=Streptomyces fructofermentans TaxID=152141 RepID=A0A918KP61_9ACTN|nr:HAMP domain-containing sensor histidine kinase [Streptomyces fructofermentans]GGX69180.1 two-component sensor histidine kinase [Streptomyces fructofermentans]
MTAPGRRGVLAGNAVRGTLAGNIVLLTTAVAAVAVLLTGLFAWRMIRTTTEAREREDLARQAEVLARTPPLASWMLDRQQRIAGPTGTELALVRPSGEVEGPAAEAVDAAGRKALLSGHAVSATAALDGRRMLVEGVATPTGGGLVLVRPMSTVDEATDRIRGSLVLPLALGLTGSALAGALLARRLARPLTSAAATAHRLAEGERGLRVRADGPTEVAELAAALNALDAALARSENRQRDFLLSVSHEIRTPLTTVRGYAEALADEVVTGDEVPGIGRVLQSEIHRLERFVGDLLALARLEADDFRLDSADVDLDALVAEAAAAWSARCARHDVDFRVERPGHALTLTTDGFRVRQLVDGLAENALRVTPAGRPLVLGLYPEGSGARLEIRDGGPGLTEDDAAIAFERGALCERYRGVRPVGSGLGLAIAHRLAHRLGGTITARGRAPEGGACFTVRLPPHPATGLPAKDLPGTGRSGTDSSAAGSNAAGRTVADQAIASRTVTDGPGGDRPTADRSSPVPSDPYTARTHP